MNDESNTTVMRPSLSVGEYLFNPFQKIAGLKSLFIGLDFITVTALIAWLGNVHFDGVLDTHIGREATIGFFIIEGLINWLSLAFVLSVIAFIVARSKWRIVDVFGTQALARWPMMITALVMLPSANRRFMDFMIARFLQNNISVKINYGDAIIFTAAAIVAIVMLVWMIFLMYRAYTVSCNLRGVRAVVSFILGLFLAEVLSKVLIIGLAISMYGSEYVSGERALISARREGVIANFQNDPELLGDWVSVDFVNNINDFEPGRIKWKGELFLEHIEFLPNGHTSTNFIWTKGVIYTGDGKTKAEYLIKTFKDGTYLFLPWLSGDVTIRGMKPKYYVLKKVPVELKD
ncbi:MAG: hypothetical protein WC374_11315 [Phycisphaerae bacterium]|jgi:hypothetical protein